MADPKPVGTSDKKDKSSVLDDDIGKDILRSWKSISVTEDAGDFDLEPVGKSKKKDFNFGKLDMDFDIGGDFGKISSFKMDMSDLDFSFPPKKNKKATEADSGKLNFQGKENQFNFSFDFDNFDIDATLSKVDTLSNKQKDVQKHVADKTDIQVSEIQVFEIKNNEVTTGDSLNKPEKGQGSETVEAMKVQVLADKHGTLLTDNQPLRRDTSGDIVSQLGGEISSDKTVYNGREDDVDRSYSQADHSIIQDFNVQSMRTDNNLGSLMEPLEEACSSGEVVNTNVGGEQRICGEAAAEAVQQKSPECILPLIEERLEDNSRRNKNLSDINGKGPSVCAEAVVSWESDLGRSPKIVQSKTLELSEDYNDGDISSSNTAAVINESSDGISYTHDSSVASAVKIQHRDTKIQLSSLSSREPIIDKSAAGKEYESKLVQLKFFGKSNEINKPNHEYSVSTKPSSSDMSTMHLDCPPEFREAIAHEKQIGITAEGGFVMHKKLAVGERTVLRNQRTLVTAIENSLQINSSNSEEKSKEMEPLKSEKANVMSITDCTQSLRHIFTAKDKSLPLKSLTRNLGLIDLKSSRCISEKKLQSSTESHFRTATTHEIKSLKDLKQKVTEDVTPKVTVLSLNEKQKSGTPTLKRKQAPTGGVVHDIPMKRLTQSPKNGSFNKVLVTKIPDQVQHKSNTMDTETSSQLVDVPRIPNLDTSGKMNSSALEIPSEIGDFGMVEKAAAYGKELDDLCNMLKKKNDEAKELLVRAVVNNNHLLLLNHPMHDEKIRSVQKLANRLMALEIVPHQR